MYYRKKVGVASKQESENRHRKQKSREFLETKMRLLRIFSRDHLATLLRTDLTVLTHHFNLDHVQRPPNQHLFKRQQE